MNRRTLTLMTALALAAPSFVVAAPQTAPTVATKIADTRAALRDLWTGHIFWVRNVVDARFAKDAARAQVAEQQVVANARALAGAVEPYYGKAASDKLFGLLAGHWGAISDYANATQAGDKAAQDAASAKLVANANEIAKFLSGANPNWPEGTLRSLLGAHGAHHIQQMQQLHAKQYEQEAQTWAAMTKHVYTIADALADGLAAQFPDKFR
jgi:hypothetical protein